MLKSSRFFSIHLSLWDVEFPPLPSTCSVFEGIRSNVTLFYYYFRKVKGTKITNTGTGELYEHYLTTNCITF